MKSKNTSKKPLISVILPVYNADQYLSQAIESIINQTYINWELIIVDDHSTDGSNKIALTYSKKDKRIHVINAKRHKGVGAISNLGITRAKGKYIARMDADDISLPDRFAKQVAYLENHPEVIILGGQCQLIDTKNKVTGYKLFPTDPEKLDEMMFYYYPIQQPTFMVRNSALPKDFVWYEEKVESAEEHELLFKLRQYGKVANLPDTTLKYRMHEKNISKQHPKRDFFHIFSVRMNAIKKYGYRPSFTGLIKNFGQLLIISVLPEKYIFPAYSVLRKFQAQENPYAK